ncbi:chorismate mutase [Mesobacillus foraminis]|uniref:chorismate mutase n=1 Tax=Mesobacillus foraminis TaxID=279826 RepID=UPI0039A37473
MIRGIRGAITVKENVEEEIVPATERLMREIIKQNGISPETVASVFVSVTEELTAAFPAKALRQIEGWAYVPVMCMQEVPVPGSLPKCIRVMFHADTEICQEDIKHVYLEGATVLRPDLLKA